MIFSQGILLLSLIFAAGTQPVSSAVTGSSSNLTGKLPVTQKIFADVLGGIKKDLSKQAEARKLYENLSALGPCRMIINFLSMLDSEQEEIVVQNFPLFTVPLMIEFSIRVRGLLEGDNSLVQYMELLKQNYALTKSNISELKEVSHATFSAAEELKEFLENVRHSVEMSRSEQGSLVFVAESLYSLFISEVQVIADGLVQKVVMKMNDAFAEFGEKVSSLPYKSLLIGSKTSDDGISGYHYMVQQQYIVDSQFLKDIESLIEQEDSEVIDAMNFSWGVVQHSINVQLAKETEEIIEHLQNFITEQKKMNSLVRFRGMVLSEDSQNIVKQLRKLSTSHAELFNLISFGVENGDEKLIIAVKDIWVDLIRSKGPALPPKKPIRVETPKEKTESSGNPARDFWYSKTGTAKRTKPLGYPLK
jgi:hypothetical protein